MYNLFSDPDIIRLPKFLSILQKPIAKYIAKTRAPQSSEGYKSIGGGSPIVKLVSSLYHSLVMLIHAYLDILLNKRTALSVPCRKEDTTLNPTLPCGTGTPTHPRCWTRWSETRCRCWWWCRCTHTTPSRRQARHFVF